MTTRIRHLVFPVAIGLGTALFFVGALHGETVEGFAEPNQEIEITGSTEPGRLTEIRVHEGDTVEQGDVLAVMEKSILDASLEIARRRSEFQGRLEAATAEYHLRRDRAYKLSLLRQEGHASPAELERAEADLAVAAAQVKLAEEEIELAELEVERIQAQIEQRIFRSPIDGVVSKLDREVGESILLNDPALMTLVQLNPLRVRFPVSMSAVSHFEENTEVKVEIPDVNGTVSATVELVAPVLDAKSGTVQITCLLNNDQGELRSGMRCLLRVPGAESADVASRTGP